MTLSDRPGALLRRVATIAAVVATMLAAAGCSTDSDVADRPAITAVLLWYPDANSGGYYAAQQAGYFEDAGLDVTIQPGGPQVSAIQMVASGRAQIGHADAAQILQAQQDDIDIVAIGALYQDNPIGVLSHEDQHLTSFEEMNGRTFVSQPGLLQPEWLENELGLDLNFQAYQGSIANFLHDPALIQQGWPTDEVYTATKEGVPVNFTPYSSSGFNPYNGVIFTSREYLDGHAEELRQFLDASLRGWADYMADVDVATETNELIHQENPEKSMESIWFGWDKQRPYLIGAEGTELGSMTADRWATVTAQMQELGALGPQASAVDAYDESLLPSIPAPVTLPSPPPDAY